MPRRTLTTWKALAVLCGMLLAIGGAMIACGSDNGAVVTNGDGGNGEGGNGDGSVGACQAGGSACTSNGDCCSSNCDTTKNQCIGGISGSCTAANGTCSVATDCCSLSCVSGKCSGTQCTSDNQACTSNDQCCGGVCGANGKCTPLNNSCLTAGNSCTAGGEQCCSTLCSGGVCQLSASFCIQAGDVCAKASDCCTGTCNIAAGATLGTCGTLANLGQNNCSGGVDGTVCGGSGDGGATGDCTACCSRLCAPYAPTGVFVCQPANGCHVEGDLCQNNYDCCGGESLLPDGGEPIPGAEKVVCLKAAGATIGYCSTPSSGNGGVGGTCNPEGDVCHYQNYYCSGSSKRDDCCPDPSNKTTCQLDPLGIPRCQVLGGDAGIFACVPTAGECAFDSDCCTGKCLPDSTGKLTCNPVTCSPTSGPCTTTADCCGGNCDVPAGSIIGTCGATNTNPDGGTCKAYGQSCTQASDCCNGVPCTNGSCQYPPR